jgi:hypothetical protein
MQRVIIHALVISVSTSEPSRIPYRTPAIFSFMIFSTDNVISFASLWVDSHWVLVAQAPDITHPSFAETRDCLDVPPRALKQ